MKDSQDIQSDLSLDWEFVNCTSWSGDAIEAITGVNPYDDFRNEFTSALGACKAIKKRGFNTLDDLIAALFTEIPVGMAQTGDVVLVKTIQWDNGDASLSEVMPHGVAIVDPPAFWAVTEDGLGRGDLYKDAVRAFAVGRNV